jgi:hypothetical protein
MAIRSADDWMDGRYDYEPADMSREVRASAIGILQAAGVVSEVERREMAGADAPAAVPEERWALPPTVRSAKGAVWLIVSGLLGILFGRLTRLPGRMSGSSRAA